MKSKLAVDPSRPSEVSRKEDRYCIPVLATALDILDCFDPDGGTMTLAEVIRLHWRESWNASPARCGPVMQGRNKPLEFGR
ncbi:MAG: hypothetical protein ACRD1Y_06485 [Terriglobales bacterium]